MSKRNRCNSFVIWHNRPTAHISCLYPEILALIFGNLDVCGKGRAAQVCHQWREACYHKSVWKGVEAKIHLKNNCYCDQHFQHNLSATAVSTSCTQHNALFSSLVKRGIKKIQLLSIQRSVRELLHSVPNMESLNLTGCYTLQEYWLTNALTRTIPSLIELNLSMCKQITDNSLDKIAHYLKCLEILDLSGCSSITNNGLLLLSRGLKRLNYLNVRSCRHISDTGISHVSGVSSDLYETNGLSHGLQALEYLGLQDCQKITDDALRHISSKLNHLKCINLSFCSGITDFGLKHLSVMSNLREINLRSCDNITDIGLGHLSDGNLRLRVLDVSFSSDKIGDQGLVHISQKMVHLNSLSLNACSGITDEGLMKISRSLNQLRILNLGQCNKITDKSLSVIADHLFNLTNIDLYGCSLITTVGLEKVTQLPNLTVLNLGLWQKQQINNNLSTHI